MAAKYTNTTKNNTIISRPPYHRMTFLNLVLVLHVYVIFSNIIACTSKSTTIPPPPQDPLLQPVLYRNILGYPRRSYIWSRSHRL